MPYMQNDKQELNKTQDSGSSHNPQPQSPQSQLLFHAFKKGPGVRSTKISPGMESKICSTGVRRSAQPMTAHFGESVQIPAEMALGILTMDGWMDGWILSGCLCVGQIPFPFREPS